MVTLLNEVIVYSRGAALCPKKGAGDDGRDAAGGVVDGDARGRYGKCSTKAHPVSSPKGSVEVHGLAARFGLHIIGRRERDGRAGACHHSRGW